MKEDIEILEEYLKYCENKFFIDSEVSGTELYKPLQNLLTRYKEMEIENKKYPIKLTDEGYRKVIQEAQDDVMGNIKELRKRNSEMITKINQLEQKNEEWQRAYQEEKDKQFELLRENEELKDRIEDFLKNKGVTDIQITAIKHQGYIEGFAQRDKLARELCEDCRKAEKNLRYIPKSELKKDLEHMKNAKATGVKQLLMKKGITGYLEKLLS